MKNTPEAKKAQLIAELTAAQASHRALLDRLAALPAADVHRDAGVRSSRGRRVTGVLNTVINSAITWAAPPQEMRDALGTASALESLSRVIAPSVGGWLLGAFGTWSPGVLAAVILAGLAAFAWRRLIVHPDPPLAAAIGRVAA